MHPAPQAEGTVHVHAGCRPHVLTQPGVFKRAQAPKAKASKEFFHRALLGAVGMNRRKEEKHYEHWCRACVRALTSAPCLLPCATRVLASAAVARTSTFSARTGPGVRLPASTHTHTHTHTHIVGVRRACRRVNEPNPTPHSKVAERLAPGRVGHGARAPAGGVYKPATLAPLLYSTLHHRAKRG